MAPCPRTAEQLVNYLETQMAAVPHVMLTDVDLSTGDLILWLDNDKRFVVTIAESSENVS